MFPYWITLLLPTLLLGNIAHRYRGMFWLSIFIWLLLFVGLRHAVGGDWYAYLSMYDRVGYADMNSYFDSVDPGYALLNWFSYQVGGGVYLVNLMSALLFLIGLIKFCRHQPTPVLALIVAIPYLVLVIAMGYTRQSVALGFVMLGLVYLSDGNLRRFLLFVIVGALFHKSAVIMLPLAVFYRKRGIKIRMLGVGAFTAIMAYLFLADHYEALWRNYVDSQMKSDGGLIRLVMNAMPAMVMVFYRHHFKSLWPDYRIWLTMGLASIALLPLVPLASTAVDRIALYLLPLQLVVFSRLPVLFGESVGRETVVRTIILYYALVQFVWLSYANTAFAWLPYQNLLFLNIT